MLTLYTTKPVNCEGEEGGNVIIYILNDIYKHLNQHFHLKGAQNKYYFMSFSFLT